MRPFASPRALLGAIAVVLTLVGTLLGTTPASGSEPASSPWISGQRVVGGTVTVSLDWEPSPPAPTYDVLVSSVGPDLYPNDDPNKQTFTVGTNHADIAGLAPGTTYCYAIVTNGAGGARACKVSPPASRAVVPTRRSTTMATINGAGGSTKNCNKRGRWKKRQKQVVDRIQRTNADVMVFVEAHLAHTYGKKKLRIGKVMKRSGYRLACQTQKSKRRKLYSQVVYVRSSVYDVGSKKLRKGSRFKRFKDRNHGYCHALIQHRATGKQIGVAALHLREGGSDATRQAEAAYVLGLMQRRFGGLPTVLLGDYNSHRGLDRRGATDAPRLVLEGAGYADASDIAAQLTYPYLNSANGYEVIPPRSSTWPTHVDRIFVSPGITVPSWENIAVLVAGRYAEPMASDHNPIKATLNIP